MVKVVPPNFVDLRVTEAPPGIKGDTATGGEKPATLQTGLVVKVPLFVTTGEVIRVDTRSGAYVERVSELAEPRWETPQPLGVVAVRQEVLSAIAARAIAGIEGVRPLRGGGIIGLLGGGEEGIQITIRGDVVDVELRIAVVLGYSVHSVAQAVQRRVREDLEGMVGIAVGRVDVHVRHVIPPEEILMLEGGEDGEG